MEVDTQVLDFIMGLKKITNISSLMSKKVKENTLREKDNQHDQKRNFQDSRKTEQPKIQVKTSC